MRADNTPAFPSRRWRAIEAQEDKRDRAV